MLYLIRTYTVISQSKKLKYRIFFHMKTKHIKLARTINELMGITPEDYTRSLHVTVSDNAHVFIRGFDALVSYTSGSVAVRKDQIICEVEGENITLFGVSEDAIRIEGCIFSVTYREAGR